MGFPEAGVPLKHPKSFIFCWTFQTFPWNKPSNRMRWITAQGISQDEIGYSAAMHSCVKARRALADARPPKIDKFWRVKRKRTSGYKWYMTSYVTVPIFSIFFGSDSKTGRVPSLCILFSHRYRWCHKWPWKNPSCGTYEARIVMHIHLGRWRSCWIRIKKWFSEWDHQRDTYN